MLTFLQRFASRVLGVLSGWDRLRLRGTKRLLAHVGGMMEFLWQAQVPLTGFRAYVEDVTATVRDGITRQAQDQGRPLLYLPSSRLSKGQVALDIAARDGIRDGLIAVLSCVEPCLSYGVHKSAPRTRVAKR